MKIPSLLSAFTITAALLLVAGVAQAKLGVGDPAPKLQCGKWVQGGPVTGFDSNHVYIVEFWATWCGPCRASIPHLNEIYEKFKAKGLVAIGQNCWEQDDDGVAPFVKKMGDKMTYNVALDDKTKEEKGAMAKSWMEAAGQDGIPAAFVVDRHGVIVWIGHPMELEESVLDQVLADKFDVAAAAKAAAEKQKQEAATQGLAMKLQTAMKSKDWKAADAAVTELEKLVPEELRSQLVPVRMMILLGQKDLPGACKLADSTSAAHPEAAQLLNQVAWLLATVKDSDAATRAMAQKVADLANTASKGSAPEILDTLARAQFVNGNTNAAVATEKKAVELAPAEEKSLLEKSLKAYQAGKVPAEEDEN